MSSHRPKASHVRPIARQSASPTQFRGSLHHLAAWWRAHQSDTFGHPDALLDRQRSLASSLRRYEH